MYSTTQRQRHKADRNFHSSAQLIRRRDIAVVAVMVKWSNATVSARIYRVLSAIDDAAARYSVVQRQRYCSSVRKF